jgi:hypothetical protein
MPVSVLIPTRIRVDAVGLATRRDVIEKALARAAGRALANSREVVLAPRGAYEDIRFCAPQFTWTGRGLDRVSMATRADLEALVAATLSRAGVDARLYHAVRAPANTPPVLPHEIGAPAEEDRFILEGDAYVIPSYQPPKGGTPRIVLVKRARQPDALSDEQRKVLAELDKDEGALFQQVLSGTRGRPGRVFDQDSLEILRAFAKRNPRRFRKLLLEAATGGAAAIGRVFDLSEGRLKGVSKDKPEVKEALRYIDIAADAMHLAGELPEAAWLVGELERRIPGFRRILAMLDPVATARLHLQGYLITAEEKTDDLVYLALDRLDLWRIPPIVAAQGGGKQAISSYDAQEDLLVYYRLLVTVLAKVREIDGWLLLYRLNFASEADKLEEVQTLLEARSRYLHLLSIDFTPLYRPTRPASTLLADVDAFYSDWRGIAADKKLASIKEAIKELRTKVHELDRNQFWSPEGREFFGVAKFGISNKPNELAAKIDALAQRLDSASKQTRDETYLKFANEAQQQIGELAVKWQLLTYWRTAAELVNEATTNDIGGDEGRVRWHYRGGVIIDKIKQEYDHPNYATLAAKMKEWRELLEDLKNSINSTAEDEAKRERRRKLIKGLVITVVAIVVTRGLLGSATIEGLQLGSTATTLVGAGTFTAVTTLGQMLVLHEQVTVRDVLVDFGKNAAFGFLFRWLNFGFMAGARYLAPGRDLAQVVIVLGSDQLVGAGVNLGMSLVETGHLPEDMQSFVISSVVIAATGTLLGGAQLREQLRKLNLRENVRNDLLTRLEHLRNEGADVFDEMRKIGAGGPDESQHNLLKQRLLRVLPEFQDVLKRMAGREFSDADLTALGLTRARLQLLANIIDQYSEIIRDSQWLLPSGQPGGIRRLPAPSEVVHDLVEVGPDAFEYNPYPTGRVEQVILLLQKRGYKVTDTGDGVLQLTGQGIDRPLLLLPSRPSLPAPALARLVTSPGPNAAEVLRKSQTNAAKGLRFVQAQNAVPSLEATLTSIAAADSETATELLVGLGRHFKLEAIKDAASVLAIKGIAHFLEIGGSPRTLAVTLGLGNEYGTNAVRIALARFNTLQSSDLAGIEAIIALRGDGRSGLDRIVGIAAGFDEPGAVFRSIGVLSSRTESGFDQLVRQLASPDLGARVQARNAMEEGLGIVVRSPTQRLRFERQTVGGASVLSVRDASLTSGRTLLSYSEKQLDDIVAQKPTIGTIRTLGAGMVQGSAGSLFEKWCRRWVLDPLGKRVAVPRLTILQKDNGHINLNAERRSSDAFLSDQGEVWDMKFLLQSGQIDRDQLEVYKAMQREGLVVTPDQQHHSVKSINYLFPDRDSAMANAFAADTVRDVRVWYIDDNGWITLLH